MEKEFRSYNVKMVETPTTIEVWEYIDEAVFYSVKLDTKSKCEDEKIIDNQTNNIANKEYDALKRKQKHYNEMRWEVARIVDCNFDDNTKFMTLTFISTTLIISKKPGNTGISRDIRTEFTTDLLLSD